MGHPVARNQAGFTRMPFGSTAAGEPVELFTLTGAYGLQARVLTYGGIIVSLRVPDQHGGMTDVVLGHDSLDRYLDNPCYLGAIVGRSAGRIAGASFTLDGTTYRLTANAGPNHLHGGRIGFDRVVWRAAPFCTEHETGIVLSHTSPDGDEGYPGRLEAQVTYTLRDRHELVVDWRAVTNRPTPVNLTQHSYFNLSGNPAAGILGHLLWINADRMTPLNEQLIPTGAILPVAAGPFDFRTPAPIGAHIDAPDPQLRLGRGYDHYFVLNRGGGGLCHAARLKEPGSGRTLDIHTTEPGLQLYTGNYLDRGLTGGAYGPRAGLCLETQHFPDAPNQPGFPSTILRPGSEYQSQTVFVFGGPG